MIEIDGHIVADEVLTARFCCDLAACRGICCVEGNSGAPLEAEEQEVLRSRWEAYRPYMKPEGVEAVERDGFAVRDVDGDLTTPLVDGAECAYSMEENGVTLCAIEKAWRDGRCDFRKPISCHLYPIRLVNFSNGATGLNYHRWSVCRPALINGAAKGVPLYRALREPIVRRFGGDFFSALETAEKFLTGGGD